MLLLRHIFIKGLGVAWCTWHHGSIWWMGGTGAQPRSHLFFLTPSRTKQNVFSRTFSFFLMDRQEWKCILISRKLFWPIENISAVAGSTRFIEGELIFGARLVYGKYCCAVWHLNTVISKSSLQGRILDLSFNIGTGNFNSVKLWGWDSFILF